MGRGLGTASFANVEACGALRRRTPVWRAWGVSRPFEGVIVTPKLVQRSRCVFRVLADSLPRPLRPLCALPTGVRLPYALPFPHHDRLRINSPLLHPPLVRDRLVQRLLLLQRAGRLDEAPRARGTRPPARLAVVAVSELVAGEGGGGEQRRRASGAGLGTGCAAGKAGVSYCPLPLSPELFT